MPILWLSPTDVQRLLPPLQRADPTLAATIAGRLKDRCWNGDRPRTILMRDEGDGLPAMSVAFDSIADADRAWAEIVAATEQEEEIEWP